MDVSLKPKVQAFIDEEVRAGRFDSSSDVVEEAIRRMMEESEIDDATAEAINLAEEQIRRGEGLSLDQFRNEFHRHVNKQ